MVLDVYCKGEYPKFVYKQLAKVGLAPEVTPEDQALLKQAKPDFLGINYYHGGTAQQNNLQKQSAEKKEFSKVDPYLMQAAAGEFSPEETMFATAENPHLKKQIGAGRSIPLVSV